MWLLGASAELKIPMNWLSSELLLATSTMLAGWGMGRANNPIVLLSKGSLTLAECAHDYVWLMKLLAKQQQQQTMTSTTAPLVRL
jgi:hypothetical protein